MNGDNELKQATHFLLFNRYKASCYLFSKLGDA